MQRRIRRWGKVRQRRPSKQRMRVSCFSRCRRRILDSPPYVPDVFAALSQPSACPPLRPSSNPCLALVFRVHRLQAHAELEVFHLPAADRLAAMPVQTTSTAIQELQLNEIRNFVDNEVKERDVP